MGDERSDRQVKLYLSWFTLSKLIALAKPIKRSTFSPITTQPLDIGMTPGVKSIGPAQYTIAYPLAGEYTISKEFSIISLYYINMVLLKIRNKGFSIIDRQVSKVIPARGNPRVAISRRFSLCQRG